MNGALNIQKGALGFIHPNHIEGGAETARIEFLVRDFDTAMLKLHAERVYAIAQKRDRFKCRLL